MKTTAYCGFDWASETHYYVLKNARKEVLSEGTVPHTTEGFEAFLESLGQCRQGGRVALIVEANRGVPMNALLDVNWLDLYPVNPMKTRKLNELQGSVRQKSDASDCHLLCDYLIANESELSGSYVERDSLIRQMQEWIGMETDLVSNCRQLKQRIMSHLDTFMPDLKRMLPNLDKKVYVRYLFEFDPLTPVDCSEVESFLRRHGCRNAETIEAFAAGHVALRALGEDAEVHRAQADVLRAWAELLWQLQCSLEDCRKRINALFVQLPQAAIYSSLPGLGETLAPRMACLFGSRPSERFACKEQAVAYFGQSPVTEQSGKGLKVGRRRNCHRYARNTCFLWAMAVNKMPNCLWQRTFLDKRRRKGDARPTRYRKLGRKMLGILYRCVIDNVPYDEVKFIQNLHQKA